MPLLGFLGFLKATEGVSLHGTEGSPEQIFHVSNDPDDALAAWSLVVTDGTNAREKGYMMSIVYDYADAATTDFIKNNPSTDFVIPHNFGVTYFVRATLVAGVNPISGFMDTWVSLVPGSPSPFGNRSWTWARTVPGGPTTGTIKLEIATDGAGANIIATGYYKATVTVLSL